MIRGNNVYSRRKAVCIYRAVVILPSKFRKSSQQTALKVMKRACEVRRNVTGMPSHARACKSNHLLHMSRKRFSLTKPASAQEDRFQHFTGRVERCLFLTQNVTAARAEIAFTCFKHVLWLYWQMSLIENTPGWLCKTWIVCMFYETRPNRGLRPDIMNRSVIPASWLRLTPDPCQHVESFLQLARRGARIPPDLKPQALEQPL